VAHERKSLSTTVLQHLATLLNNTNAVSEPEWDDRLCTVYPAKHYKILPNSLADYKQQITHNIDKYWQNSATLFLLNDLLYQCTQNNCVTYTYLGKIPIQK